MTIKTDDLYILADQHHFIIIAKDTSTEKTHLKAIQKIEYSKEKYDPIPKKNSSHVFDRRGIARPNQLGIDPNKKAAQHYLKDACKGIEEVFKSGQYKRIALVAIPDVIAVLKQGISKNMKDKIFREIHKDYTKTSLHDLELKLLNESTLV